MTAPLWRKAASFDEGVASPITWLVAIARNRSIDRLRSQATFRSNVTIETAADVPDASLSAIEQLEIGDDQARLRDCLQELEERQSARRFLTASPMSSWLRRRACRSVP